MAVRIAVDAMGGDHAPRALVSGAVTALRDDPDIEVVLVGDEAEVRRELDRTSCNGLSSRIHLVHAADVVAMNDSPIEALKRKTDSSLLKMVRLAAAGEVDAVLSAGHTGACAAACQLALRPLPCVLRPGIAVTIPSFFGPFVLCDVGANIHAKPRHLYDYAVMASLYAQRVVGIEEPKVALISIGEESGKGTDLVRQTHELLREDPSIHFVGNAEGSDLFEGRCNVAISDGFVGNVILKALEGVSEGLFRTILREVEGQPSEVRAGVDSALHAVRQRHDYSRYGGAPLLGINGVCIICHGRSNEYAVLNAVKAAHLFVRLNLNEEIVGRLS